MSLRIHTFTVLNISIATYNKYGKDGGSQGGTIRLAGELSEQANKGLSEGVNQLELIYQKLLGSADEISHGDLYTLAGVVSIQVLGGPKIRWRAGRKDLDTPSPADTRIPHADMGSPAAT
jgi:cytochrome c peroxidase